MISPVFAHLLNKGIWEEVDDINNIIDDATGKEKKIYITKKLFIVNSFSSLILYGHELFICLFFIRTKKKRKQ